VRGHGYKHTQRCSSLSTEVYLTRMQHLVNGSERYQSGSFSLIYVGSDSTLPAYFPLLLVNGSDVMPQGLNVKRQMGHHMEHAKGAKLLHQRLSA
jgi:hypothetical protein